MLNTHEYIELAPRHFYIASAVNSYCDLREILHVSIGSVNTPPNTLAICIEMPICKQYHPVMRIELVNMLVVGVVIRIILPIRSRARIAIYVSYSTYIGKHEIASRRPQ